MYLVKPSFKIESLIDGEHTLKMIELAGRTCYKSEDKITTDSAKAFIAMLLKRGHESVLEHEKITVRIVCDRGVSHEIVRHRIASYSQESTRYCNYKGGVTFVIPPWLTGIEEREYTIDEVDDMTIKLPISGMSIEWLADMALIEEMYIRYTTSGWSPQQARCVLPNSTKTEIVITMNLREWRWFFRKRADIAAHPQMQEIAYSLLEEFKKLMPIVFDDLLSRGQNGK
jgi:thymidylate synthase (FAD)